MGERQSVIKGTCVSLSIKANLPIYSSKGFFVLESSGRKTILPKYGESKAINSLLILVTINSIS